MFTTVAAIANDESLQVRVRKAHPPLREVISAPFGTQRCQKRGVSYLREMLLHCKNCSVTCKARVKQVNRRRTAASGGGHCRTCLQQDRFHRPCEPSTAQIVDPSQTEDHGIRSLSQVHLSTGGFHFCFTWRHALLQVVRTCRVQTAPSFAGRCQLSMER